MKILSVFASRKGSSGEIAACFSDILAQKGHNITTVNAEERIANIQDYDTFLLGSGIYNGAWLPSSTTFLQRAQMHISNAPVFAWAACIRVLEPDGYQHALQHYMPLPLFAGLRIQAMGVFAGQLVAEEVDWNERWTLSLHYDGNQHPYSLNADFRDWDVIRNWGERVAERLTH